jgi:hypothetical protein
MNSDYRTHYYRLLQVAGTFDDFLALREGTQQSSDHDEAQLPFSVGTALSCEEDSVVICGPLLWCIKRHTVDTNCSEVCACVSLIYASTAVMHALCCCRSLLK